MEKTDLKQYRPSSGDKNLYYHETSAAEKRADFNTSAAIGNLADVMKCGPVKFPNILAPNSFRRLPLGKTEAINPGELSER